MSVEYEVYYRSFCPECDAANWLRAAEPCDMPEDARGVICHACERHFVIGELDDFGDPEAESRGLVYEEGLERIN